jgi:hypothetical protein
MPSPFALSQWEKGEVREKINKTGFHIVRSLFRKEAPR